MLLCAGIPTMLFISSLQWSVVVVVSCCAFTVGLLVEVRWEVRCAVIFNLTSISWALQCGFMISNPSPFHFQIAAIWNVEKLKGGWNFWVQSGFWIVTHLACGWKTSGIQKTLINKYSWFTFHVVVFIKLITSRSVFIEEEQLETFWFKAVSYMLQVFNSVAIWYKYCNVFRLFHTHFLHFWELEFDLSFLMQHLLFAWGLWLHICLIPGFGHYPSVSVGKTTWRSIHSTTGYLLGARGL